MSTNATRSSDFLGSLGVAAHIEDRTSSYGSSNVASQLSYIGINNVRVQAPYANLGAYTALGALGYKFDVVSTTTNLAQQMAFFDSIAPYVASVEGPNEVNSVPVTYQGLKGAAAAGAFQKDLYAAVHADPLLKHASVLPFSLSVGAPLTGYGNVAAYADYGNVHGYASDGVPPYYMLPYATSSVTTTPGKQPIMSETGYYTLADGKSGVSQYVQGVWLMDTLLENWSHGVAKTYLYQLEDGYANPVHDPENHYGLYTVDGTPKQAATDLHNLTTILADTGPGANSFTPGTLNYTISGLQPDYGFSTLFAKSDGRFDIALWSEPRFFNAKTGVASTVKPSAVTIALDGTYNVNIYDPVTGTAPVSTRTAVTSVSLSLGTDPLIVEVTPAKVAAPAVTLGTGPDAIVVKLSEDAWNGDALFTLQVDGTQIGGTQTAAALHGAGATQAFTLLGSFGAAQHTVTVTFLNDAYGGTGSTDRNLYVDSLTTANGTVVAANAGLLSNGSRSFVLPAGAGAGAPVAPVTLGSGADLVSVAVSEDAWNGDAQFTLRVDGTQIGGVQSTTALHGRSASQAFDLHGTFGAGSHTLTVTFLNDAYGGTATTDRNLYVETVTAGGTRTVANAGLLSSGSRDFAFNLPGNSAAVITPTTLGSGRDSMVVRVSEDAWKGDAQFTFQVDGRQIGGVQTATSLHGSGQSDSFALLGDFGSGTHALTVTFLNDAYGGTAATDRNLYVDSVTAGGATTTLGAALLSSGSRSFDIVLGHIG